VVGGRVLAAGEDPEEALRTRDKNRQRLNKVINDFETFRRNDWESAQHSLRQMHGSQQEINAMRGELQQIRQQVQETSAMRGELQQIRQQVQETSAMRGELQQMRQQVQETTAMKSEIQQLRQQLQQLQGSQHEITAVRGDLQQVRQQIQGVDQLKSELKSGTQSINMMKNELQSVKGDKQALDQMKNKLSTLESTQSNKLSTLEQQLQAKQSEHKRDLDELKRGTHSKDLLTSLQSKVDLVTMQFTDLKDQIYSKGLLAPKVEVPEDPEEHPPVGTVQLGEDVFTARLLMHLGFMKARKDAFDNSGREDSGNASYMGLGPGKDEKSGSDEEDEFLEGFIDDDNVHGITDLEVTEPGRPGYCAVAYAWPFICACTFVLQILIILILIQGAKDAGEGCLRKPLLMFSYEWWLLHMSKGLAIGVAGILMGQELMDVVNYSMVSCLVEPHINWEIVLVAFARVSLSMLIAFANVRIFSYLKHAVSVWINMTALAFIGELGTGMLEVAKRGVFGHTLMKTITNLNFELTFVHQYPAWFPLVRLTVLALAMTFIGFFAVYAFVSPDVVCKDHQHNGTHVLFPHPFLPGDSMHHGHSHR
jgi:hypothetical protein